MQYLFILSLYQSFSSPGASSSLPHDSRIPRATQICVKPHRLSWRLRWRLSWQPNKDSWSQDNKEAILFIGSSLHPQALILLKIAPAARTYGLHLCFLTFFIFFRLFLFATVVWWKENSDKINKMHIQGDVFHCYQNA